MSPMPIRVLVVDDSAAVRSALASTISALDGLEVMATAKDPYDAAAKISQSVPDVMTLDVEMPKMNGLVFLKKVMRQCPIPTVVCSNLTSAGSQAYFDAIEAGAVAVVEKPRFGRAKEGSATVEALVEAIRTAICARAPGRRRARQAHRQAAPAGAAKKLTADVVLAPLSDGARARLEKATPITEPVICIGASTGGTQALEQLLESLPADAPGIAIVQHMPERFTGAFAERLCSRTAMRVHEARSGDPVRRGSVLIAPGGRHLVLERTSTRYRVTVVDGPPVARHRPSVDVLFRSAAQCAAHNAIGVLMTGMGDDGAAGLSEIREAGGFTIAQDEATSVVFGMPKAAIDRGAACKVIGLPKLADALMAQAALSADQRREQAKGRSEGGLAC